VKLQAKDQLGLSSRPSKASRRQSSVVAVPSTNTATRKAQQATENYAMSFKMAKPEQVKLKSRLIEFIVHKQLPFNIVESDTFLILMESIRPGVFVFIPKITQVGGKMLDEPADSAVAGMHEKTTKLLIDGRKAGLVMDDWKDQVDRHVEGILVTLGDEVFAHGATSRL
jgi:hypothetical protein